MSFPTPRQALPLLARRTLLMAAVERLAGVPLLAAEFDQIWQRVQTERRAGRADRADAGKEEAVLRDEYRAIAERRVRLRLLIAAYAEENGLTVSEAETSRAIRQEVARHRGQERQVLDFYRDNAAALEALRAPLLEEKVVDLLIARVRISERRVSPEELGAV